MIFELVLLIFSGTAAMSAVLLQSKTVKPTGEYWDETVPLLWIMSAMFAFFAVVSWAW